MQDFLPVNREEMEARGWKQPDFVFVIGDAYVDHPSFGPAVISRYLEALGYRIAIISQPSMDDPKSINVFGEPRLGFLVNSGNEDSMVNHYTVTTRRRQEDLYSPGGAIGLRPDYALAEYGQMIRKLYPNKPMILCGVEASLRRLAQYDYWAKRVKRSVLLNSGADILVYGDGEHAIADIANELENNVPIDKIHGVSGTVYRVSNIKALLHDGALLLPTYRLVKHDKEAYAKSFMIQYNNTDFVKSKPLIEQYGDDLYLVQNTAYRPLTGLEMDRLYSLPYCYDAHPSYKEKGGVPAMKYLAHSFTSSRGCPGDCPHCPVVFHQGRIAQRRSKDSVLAEINRLATAADFNGVLHDLSGNVPKTAVEPSGKLKAFPTLCPYAHVATDEYKPVDDAVAALPNVRRLEKREILRQEYLLTDVRVNLEDALKKDNAFDFPKEKEKKLSLPTKEEIQALFTKTEKIPRVDTREIVCACPGFTLEDAIDSAVWNKSKNTVPRNAEAFYPVPGTLYTCMFYTGIDPRTMQPVSVVDDYAGKDKQKALFKSQLSESRKLIKKALEESGRKDLLKGRKSLLD